MATQVAIETHRENAEISYGNETCKQKVLEALAELELPSGLIPLDNVLEFGYNRATGFTWIKREKSVTHVFRSIGETVSYAQEATAFVEKHRMKKCVGVKVKYLLIWVNIGQIVFSEKDPEKLTFVTSTGAFSRSYPITAFEADGKDEGKKKKVQEVEKK